jgi:hypothetical protein
MRRPHSVSAGFGRLRCQTSRLSSYAPINYLGPELKSIGRCSAPSTGTKMKFVADHYETV